MQTITISTENSETYSSISNFFIDYYMTSANGEFVKVYLYLVRLLSHGSDITVAQIADHFNLTEKDICRAIRYWVSQEVLRFHYDGKGNITGIILLPLKAPVNEHALLPTEKKAPAEVLPLATPVKEESVAINEEPVVAEVPSIEVPVKPRYNKAHIDQLATDQDFADIIYQVQTLFGHTLSTTDTNILSYVYENLGFGIELFEYLIEYCVSMGKHSCRYMEAVAIGWYKEGIKTKQQAKEQASPEITTARVIFKALNLPNRSVPVEDEKEYIKTWTTKFGFDNDMIKYACDQAIALHPGSVTFKYLNSIFENWKKNNVHCLADVERMNKEHASNSQNNQTSSKKVVGFKDYSQRNLDKQLDELADMFLDEVIHS